MVVCIYWGFLALMAKENVYLGPTLSKEKKLFVDDGVRALPKVLEAYIVRQCGQPNPPKAEQHGLHGHWPTHGGIFTYYGSSCCSVAPASR